jgi:polysaccharide biosynthesis protein VpsM
MAKTAIAFAVSLAVAGISCAQDGTGVQSGPFRVKPTLGLTVGHDSNVAQSNTSEISSFFTLISPGIRVDAGNEVRSFSLSYELDSARYQDSKTDNFTDHHLTAGVTLSPSVRTKLDVGASFDRGHDRRGTNFQQGLAPGVASLNNRDVDRWERKGVDVGFDYGAPGARGALGLDAGISDINYQNNESYSVRGNRDLKYFGGRFGWRIAPKTQAYFSARNTDVSYDVRRTRAGLSNYLLDSTDRTYLIGLQFDATEKTSGHLGFGRTQKNFDDNRIKGYSGVAWDVGVQFRPRSYSVIDLSATRGTQESVDFLGDLVGTDYLIARDVTLSWTHGWSDRFHTGVDLGQSNSEYLRDDRGVRNDSTNFWGLSADYKLRDWLSLGAGYKSYRRNGDVVNSSAVQDAIYDFNRDEVSVSFEASL